MKIKHLTNLEDVVIVIRQQLSKQAEMNINDVINADSIRGAMLSKIVDGVQTPYSAKESVIVFELVETTDVDISAQLESDDMLDISSHEVKLVIYGDDSRTVSRKLKARMLSQKVIEDLSKIGINIMNISNITSTTEFINTTRYLRRDMSIRIICSMQISSIDSDEAISDASLTILKLTQNE
jgi:hypothetical protein